MRVLSALSIASLAVLARPFAPPARRFDVPRRLTSSPLGGASNGGGGGGGGGPMDDLFSFVREGKKRLVKSIAGDYDAVAVRGKIDRLISDNPVLMLSFTTCPYCIKAKAVLDEKGARYTVVELDVESDGRAVRAEMGQMLGRTSVPAIWIDGVFIGGCNDGPPEFGGIISLNSGNVLDGMLKSAGSI